MQLPAVAQGYKAGTEDAAAAVTSSENQSWVIILEC